ncbi:MAG: tetratricopeptide repeat protein [Acidobacteriota bacterium]
MTFLFTSILIVLTAAQLNAHGLPVPSSPAEKKINRLQQAIAKNPPNVQLYNQLAWAFCSRARETSDPSFYDRAEEVLRKSLALDPADFEAQKIRVWALLGKHRFSQALEEAERLRKRAPDDVLVYGYLVDANIELGNYEQAEEAAQWMLDLRPGNVPGLTRAAYLRELFGDIEGAIQFMEAAYQRTPGQESEDLAWILTQVAHLHLLAGRPGAAEAVLDQALEHFPGYHYALAQLARLRTCQNRHADAVKLLRERYKTAPHPENLYDLARSLVRAGCPREARALFRQFEKKALAESEKEDNANRELIFYYATRNPRKALRIAEREYQRRRDVYTLDAYAWALYVNGRHAEARRHSNTALAVGVRDPELLKRAAVIGGEKAAFSRTFRPENQAHRQFDFQPAE